MTIVLVPAFVPPNPLKPGDAGRRVLGLNGVEPSPLAGDGELRLVPVLRVPLADGAVGGVPIMPVEGGLPIIVPGVPEPGVGPVVGVGPVAGAVEVVGAVAVPAPPLVTPVAAPEDAPDGEDAAPAAAGAAALGVVAPAPVLP